MFTDSYYDNFSIFTFFLTLILLVNMVSWVYYLIFDCALYLKKFKIYFKILHDAV